MNSVNLVTVVHIVWRDVTAMTTMFVKDVPNFALNQAVLVAKIVLTSFAPIVGNVRFVPMTIFVRTVRPVQNIGMQDVPTATIVAIVQKYAVDVKTIAQNVP